MLAPTNDGLSTGSLHHFFGLDLRWRSELKKIKKMFGAVVSTPGADGRPFRCRRNFGLAGNQQ